ncbi:MAG: adenine nucleotide alpha hydrolase [Spirochaetaceae bacterium]|nr:adenine nucleotide alpha hydrolase [Spirochaetaceae bacterium]
MSSNDLANPGPGAGLEAGSGATAATGGPDAGMAAAAATAGAAGGGRNPGPGAGSGPSILEEALRGKAPPWLERFLSAVGRGAHRHAMFAPGDKVLIGVSGGKDSLALAAALALRRRRLPFDLELRGVLVDWTPFPAAPEGLARIEACFRLLGLPFEVLRADPADYAASGPFSCYACARARKRLLFGRAQELGFGVVAFAHHLDDFAETALMNLCFRGRFEPLAPVRNFGEGRGKAPIRVVRPLCELRESAVRTLAARLELPVLSVDCPYKATNLRGSLKPIVADLSKMDTLVRENIYRACFGPPPARDGGASRTGNGGSEED